MGLNTLRYFAYGSNLHPERLRRRTPSAHPLGTHVLSGWALRFHKRGRDGSGKCNVVWTGRDADAAHGAVYEIDVDERVHLDRAESLGRGCIGWTWRATAGR